MNFLGNTVVQILNASFVEGIVRNFETILPVQAIFLPLAAAITGEKADLSEPWLYLLFIHWLGSVLHSLWTFANPFHCLLYLVRIDSIHSQGDPSYDWLLHYWINHPSHARKRTFNTLSRSASAVNMNNPMPFIRGADGERGLLHTGERASKIAFAHPPRDNETVWFFRDGVLFRLSASSGFEKITVRCFAKSRQPLVAFLREARAFHRKTQTKKVPFHTYDHPGGTWETFTKPHRPLSTIKIPRSTKESLLQDVVGFLDDEKWYALRGIPWRRTYFLHGPVGSGKSSTIHALASELQLAIYALDLRLTGMDISTIGAAIRSVPARSLIQIEGIDALLADHQRNVIGIGHQRGGDGPQQEAMVSAVDMRCPFGAGSAHSETRRASESLGLTLPGKPCCAPTSVHAGL